MVSPCTIRSRGFIREVLYRILMEFYVDPFSAVSVERGVRCGGWGTRHLVDFLFFGGRVCKGLGVTRETENFC